jgi:thiol-disulfide isomerase/thioredoxin
MGHHSAAIERLSPIRMLVETDTEQGIESALAGVVRAMAYQKLGQTDKARAQLAATDAFAAKAEFDPERASAFASYQTADIRYHLFGDADFEGFRPVPAKWADYLRYHICRREATALIAAGSAAGSAPSTSEAAASPASDQGKPDPDGPVALHDLFTPKLRNIHSLVQSDADKAASALEALKSQVEALAPTRPESQIVVQRARMAVRYFEDQIAETREQRVELEALLKANADDPDALSRYTNKVMQELRRLVASNPEAARTQLDSAKSFLTGLKASAKEATKPAIDGSMTSLSSLMRRINADNTRNSLVGKKAAPLAVETWVNGSPLRDEDLKGKVVLLDFWAVWCGPCVASFPHLRALTEKYADKGLVIIGLTTYFNYEWDETSGGPTRSEEKVPPEREQAMLVKFAAKHKLTHRFGIGGDYANSEFYGLTSIPQMVVLDRDGVIRHVEVGNTKENAKAIADVLEKLLEPSPNAGG